MSSFCECFICGPHVLGSGQSISYTLGLHLIVVCGSNDVSELLASAECCLDVIWVQKVFVAHFYVCQLIQV